VNDRTCSRFVGLLLALGVPLLLSPSVAHAAFLPISFAPGAPTISGSNGTLSYNAATGDFSESLTGASLVYAAPFVLPRGFATFSGSLAIDLKVDKGGNFVSNGNGLLLTGTVTINGATFSGPTAANPLLSGTITNFGAPPAGPPSLTFDGTFVVTGGVLTQTMTGTGGQPVFGGFPVGGPGGFLLVAENVTGGTLGDFTQSFSSSSVKPTVGDLVVPQPGSLVLLLTGAVLLAGGARAKLRLTARRTARPTTC
jgi:hypothetical protein